MSAREQLRWGGLLIIVVSVLMSMSILVYLNYRSAAVQALYGAGYTGLVLAASIVHIAQAKRAGMFGLLAYLISVLSLMYVEVMPFLTLAELAGIQEAQPTLQGLWIPGMRMAFYGVFAGLILLGIAIARAGVFPGWPGILLALGVALQLPAQFALGLAGPLFYIFAIGGSILFATGLAWVGWALWSGNSYQREEPGLSNLDRSWGAPLVLLTGFLLAIDAMLNMLGGLSLASGISHVLSYTVIVLAAFILYTAHGSRASWFGFTGLVFTQLGATLYMITASLIFAQLSGAIDNNRALMASWENIPVGRYGGYMVIFGMLLFGMEAVRSGVFPRWSGWLVLLGLALALPFTFTIQAYYLGIFWVLAASDSHLETTLNETLNVIAARTQPVSTLGNLPLTVISHGHLDANAVPPSLGQEVRDEYERAWQELQREITALSRQGRQIVAERSGHNVIFDQPELVIQCILEMIGATRAQFQIRETQVALSE